MEVTVMLCDAAQVSQGKLYILGGGWNVANDHRQVPAALAIVVDVPWDQCNIEHNLKVELLDGDGQPVRFDEEKPVTITGHFEAGRPAGMPQGASVNAAMVLGGPPLQLQHGQRYEWCLSIDDEITARAPFTTRRQR